MSCAKLSAESRHVRRHNRFMCVMLHVSRPRLYWYRFLLFALHESDTRNAVFNHGFSKGLH